jgi:carboxylesterase type B
MINLASYRLDIFGFPAAPNQPANLGLRDQRFALEWLRDNIQAFGGDPSRIVWGGQSAGADSGAAMMYTHPDDPIVAGLILQSGVPEYIGEADGSAWRRVAGVVGCAVEDLSCMRRVPVDTLKHAVGTANATFHLFGAPAGGNPIVDNVTHFGVREYLQRGAEGRFAKVVSSLPSLVDMLL